MDTAHPIKAFTSSEDVKGNQGFYDSPRGNPGNRGEIGTPWMIEPTRLQGPCPVLCPC